eukprot:Gb_19322 [translate_table: standard]
MGIIIENISANAISFDIKGVVLIDVIDGHPVIMVLIAEILPPTSNYRLVCLKRWEVRSFGSKVSSCKSTSLKVMGGDPLVTEPSTIKIEDDVKEILDKAGKVTVDGLEFIISEGFIAKVSGLSKEGEIIYRKKTNQSGYLDYEILDFGRSCSPSVALKISSGTPVSRAQLLLGPSSASPISSVESSSSVDNEDSPNEDCGTSMGKKGISRKRKTTPQTLVKGKEKVSDLAKDNRDSSKVLQENQRVLKELRSHLKILNGLGGSLTRTCACINLLTLEIINYLKEVVSHLKELTTGNL